jgi:hypothetical protein
MTAGIPEEGISSTEPLTSTDFGHPMEMPHIEPSFTQPITAAHHAKLQSQHPLVDDTPFPFPQDIDSGYKATLPTPKLPMSDPERGDTFLVLGKPAVTYRRMFAIIELRQQL